MLEGFDFGVGILLPFLGKDADPSMRDTRRRAMINTIGPHWDGNDVWLLTAGGATFAAFPQWYATLFSGFYLALFLLLLALIVRGVAFEFRSKDENPRWRALWDWCIFFGSAIPALLLGVAIANLVRGVSIDQNMNYVGTFFDLLNPYALIVGVASLLTFTLHGAIFLSLKTTGDLLESARKAAGRLWLPVVLALLTHLVGTYLATDALSRQGVNPGIIPLTGMAVIFVAVVLVYQAWTYWVFRKRVEARPEKLTY